MPKKQLTLDFNSNNNNIDIDPDIGQDLDNYGEVTNDTNFKYGFNNKS